MMPVKTIQELGEDKATAVVYNHSKAKLLTRKNKVTRCRSETFLLITRRGSSARRYCTERRPSLSPSTRKPKLKLITEGTNCKVKLKLEVSIVSTSLHHGPQTLYFDLRRETAVSSLKELIGFQPQHQRLLSQRNFQLFDQLTLHKNAVDKDDIISLSTENPAQDEPNEICKPRDKEPEPGPHNDVREDEQNKQKGELTQRGEPDRDSDGSRVSCFRCVKTKLQIFVRNSTPWGPKTLCFQLKPETCISTLKSLIFSKIGVQNQHQRLYIRRYFRNFQLSDLLTLGDYGIQQDENISLCLPTDGLLGGGQHDKVQVDEQFLQDLSTEVEESWRELAERLSYRKTEIWQISTTFEGNKERSRQMLLSWWKKQTNPEERLERLREALTAIGLSKVILLVPETCQEGSSIKGSMKSYRGGGLEQEERGQQKGTGTEGLNLEREGSSEQWENRTRREGDQDTSQEEKQQLREELRRCSQQEMSSSKEYDVSTSKEYEVLSSKEYEVSSSEDDEVLSSKECEVSSSKEYEVSSSEDFEVSSSKDYEVSPSKEYEVSSSKEYEVMEGQYRYKTPYLQNKQQLLTREYQSTSAGMLPAPEENKIQKSIYQKPREAQVDSFYGGHAEFQEEVGKQMSPLYQYSCFLGRDIAPSASHVGSPSALSALQRRCSLQRVSVDALSIYATNSPTFLAPVYQPTLQFVQNVTFTHNRLVETGKAVPTGKDIATTCRKELEEQCTATGVEGRTITGPEEAAIQCQKELKKIYMTTGSYVQLIPWIELDMKHIKAVYTKILLQTNVHDIKEDTENYEDFFLITTIEGQVIKRVILCGPVGAGKSTILRKIAYDWAVGSVEVLRKFTLLFVLKMSTVKESSNLIDLVFLQLLAHDTAVDKADLNTFIHDKESSSGVLILLDGFDEFQATNIDPSKFGSVLKMLNRKVGQDWFVVVTTRPSCSDDLTSKLLVQHPFVHVSVLGFRPEDVNQYVLRFYSDNLVTAEKLLDRIRSSIVLSDLTKIPMLLLLMCLLWREGAQLPDTLSRLFDEAMGFIFRRKMPHLSKEAASDVAAEIARAVGKTAIQGLLLPEQRHSFQEREFERSVLDRAIQAGVLKSQRVIKSLDMQSIVQFIDKTFQEYCAGKYYQCLQDREFREIHNKIDDPCAFGNLLRFCCGDNEQCAERVLNSVFKKLWTPAEAELALNCYFESQSISLLPVDLIEAFVAGNMVVDYNTHDSLNSFLWFLKHIGSGYLSRIHSLTVARSSLPKFNEVFASHLADMNQLKSLGLTSCHITAQDVIAIATSASELANLTDLDLSHNKGLGGHAETWVAGLKSMKSLKKLKMRNCGIQYEDLIHLVEIVSNMGNLMHCDFSLGKWVEFNVLPRGNSIHANIRASSLTDEDVANILKSLSNRKDLASLTVHGVHGVSGSASLWIPLLKNLTNLEKLILNSCSLESKDMEYLAGELSQMVSLTELSLEGNTSLGGSAKSWAPGLNLMVHLARLSLGWCDLKFTDIKHLVATLRKMPSLKNLSLRGNWSLGGFAEAWAPCLEEMVHVVYLDMDWCELKMTDMKHLVVALNRIPTLEKLSLKGNQNLGKAIQKHSATDLNQLKCNVCLDMSLWTLELLGTEYPAAAPSHMPVL